MKINNSKQFTRSIIITSSVLLYLTTCVLSSTFSDDYRRTASGELIKVSRPIYDNGVYDNPWPTAKKPGFFSFLKWKFTGDDNSEVPSEEIILDGVLPVKMVSDEEIDKFCNDDSTNTIRVMWLGQATVLVSMDNFVFITDPIFSKRAGPTQLIGPKRYRPVPITIDQLPRLDAVVISHNHYDHLDYNSVKSLHAKFGTKLTWLCGMGIGEWLINKLDIKDTSNVHELTWWDTVIIGDINIEFVFTPTQHWSRRGLFDNNKSLWGSWAVLAPSGKRFFFTGDTGYCPVFSEIGKIYGPFDLAAIPIGAYEPRWFMQPHHINPADAVQIHKELRSNKSFGIHWGTFKMSDEFYLEPKTKLAEEVHNANLASNSFTTLQHGEIYHVV